MGYPHDHSATPRRCGGAGRHYGFEFDPALPVRELGPAQRDLLLYGVDEPPFQRHFPDVEPPPTVAKGRFEGVVTNLLRRHAEHASDADYLEKIERFLIRRPARTATGRACGPRAGR